MYRARDRALPALRRAVRLSALAMGLLLIACGGPVAGPPGQTPGSGADVDGFVADLPAWTSFAPSSADRHEPAGPPSPPVEEVVGADAYTCSTTPYDLTRTPDEIVTYSPNASTLWLGALIQGRSYLDGLGSLREVPIRQRAPLRLRIDLLTGDNSVEVDDPAADTVNAAIGALIDRAMAAGHKAGSDISYKERVTHATEQALLELGLSAKYYGGSARAELEAERNASQTTITAHFVQKMFTVSIVLPQRPSALFSSEFTQELLDEQVESGNLGKNNLPVYVANIAYGRILTYSMTSSYEEERMRAAIAFSYDGGVASGSAYSEAQLRDTLSQSEIKVVALGGDDDNALSLIRSGDLKSYFETDSPLSTARPISYQLNNLDAANSLAKVSETTTYNVKECVAVPKAPVGERIRVTLKSVTIHSACDSGLEGEQGELYGSLSLNGSTVWSRSSGNALTVQDGTTVSVNRSAERTLYYARNDGISIAGSLFDWDFYSGDDRLGRWSITVTERSAKGDRTSRSVGDHGCASTLNYRVERLGLVTE